MKPVFYKIPLFLIVVLWLTPAALIADDIELLEVTDGIFLVQGVHEQMTFLNKGAIGNSGFIVGQQAVAVIDPGGSKVWGDRFRKAIRGVTDLPIEYLVLTHFHPDHVAGAMAFAEVPNVIAHVNYPRAMAQRAQFYIDRFRVILPGTVGQVFRLPTRLVDVGQPIAVELGSRTISIEAYPLAHTDNDLTVHDENSNTLWASDLVFAQRTPSLDGSLNGWLAVMEKMDKRQFELTIPGHGLPGDWEEITASQKKYLTDLRDSVKELVLSETSLSDVLALHDENGSKNASWALYAAQHGSNLAKAYTELEWE